MPSDSAYAEPMTSGTVSATSASTTSDAISAGSSTSAVYPADAPAPLYGGTMTDTGVVATPPAVPSGTLAGDAMPPRYYGSSTSTSTFVPESAGLPSDGVASAAGGLPPVLHESWDGIKVWIRQELDLAMKGHSIQTRENLNP